MIRQTSWVTLLTAVLTAGVACSDDDSAVNSSRAGSTIPQVAEAAGSFDTLVTALEVADLADTLSGDGPFTVFAPNDAAFAALPEADLNALLADPDALSEVLLYHVVAGELDAAAVSGVTELTSLQGSSIPVVVEGGGVFVAGAAVTTSDIAASNGVIHAIDAVIFPPGVPRNIAEVATEAGTFNTLLAAVEAAGLSDTLANGGPFTVFAPNDAAFAQIPEADLNALLADTDALTEVLLYHVVPGEYDAAAVTSASLLATAGGSDLRVELEGGNAFVGGSQIIETDIAASNGIIHVVDRVIFPPGTIADVALESDDLSTLVAALQAADLVETLRGEGPFTVFAPSNAAFAQLPESDLNALLADVPALTEVLLYHVVADKVDAAMVVASDSLPTIQGSSLAVAVDAGAVTVGNATVTVTDIPASNGIIHLIDDVLFPASE